MNGENWPLQDVIGDWIAKWYAFVLVFLIGGAIGWGSVWVFPADYEARAPLYVAFNSDALFTSPDDYKNAQFEEATDLMLSSDVLGGLDEGEKDAMGEKFSVQWRNAGQWDLVVEGDTADRVSLLARLWRNAAYETISSALSHAQRFSQLDLEVNLTARQLSEITQTQTRLDVVAGAVQAWVEQSGLEQVSVEERAELWGYAEEFSPPNRFPEDGSERQVYLVWAESFLAGLESKQDLLESEYQVIQAQMEMLSAEWNSEKTASRGLSAYLIVEMGEKVETKVVREPGLLALVGGFVGVLGWIGFRLVQVSRSRELPIGSENA